MGTLASQAEIDVWLQTPGTLQWIEIVYDKSCNRVHFGQKLILNAVYNAFVKRFNNADFVPTRSRSK